MKAQANLFTGGTTAAVAATNVLASAVTGAAGGNLFTDNTLADNSLYTLINGLPTGTVVYYASGTVATGYPSVGGTWAIAASTSTGSTCVDYTGVSVSNSTVLTTSNGATDFPHISTVNTCN